MPGRSLPCGRLLPGMAVSILILHSPRLPTLLYPIHFHIYPVNNLIYLNYFIFEHVIKIFLDERETLPYPN